MIQELNMSVDGFDEFLLRPEKWGMLYGLLQYNSSITLLTREEKDKEKENEEENARRKGGKE